MGRNASISKKVCALSLMESSISAMASSSSGLNLAVEEFDLHLMEKKRFVRTIVRFHACRKMFTESLLILDPVCGRGRL